MLKNFKEKAPEPQHLLHVGNNLYWLRISMPFALDHINIWLIEEADGWVVIDTGPNTSKAKEQWLVVINNQLKGKPITRIICTHGHPDHIGLVGWLLEELEHKPSFSISMPDYKYYQMLFSCEPSVPREQLNDFYTGYGEGQKQVKAYFRNIDTFRSIIYPVDSPCQVLQDEQIVTLGNHQWRIVMGYGHASEHACFYCQELDILIAGDQILPSITPNISIWPDAPDANPMQLYFDSAQHISTVITDETLILPAHGLAFYGGVSRLNKIVNGHKEKLEQLYLHCKEPKQVNETYQVLFNCEVDSGNDLFAFGEALASLQILVKAGRLKVTLNEQGVKLFQQA